jgi:hypothetical protein
MDVAFTIDATPLRLQRLAVGYAQLEDVVLRDQGWWHGARHQKNVRISCRTYRDVPEAIENVLVDQNPVRRDEVCLPFRLRVGGHPLGRGKLGTADDHDADRKCC